jgi:hypothetical protein
LPVLLDAANGLAEDARELRAAGRDTQAEAVDALQAEYRKAADAIRKQGYTASVSVFLKDAAFGEMVPLSQVEPVREEFLDMAGVQSANWSPNVLTVKLSVFLSYNQIREWRSLDGVEVAYPETGNTGLDPIQAEQQDVMIAALRDVKCDPPLSTPFDAPVLP